MRATTRRATSSTRASTPETPRSARATPQQPETSARQMPGTRLWAESPTGSIKSARWEASKNGLQYFGSTALSGPARSSPPGYSEPAGICSASSADPGEPTADGGQPAADADRSEEHTSELQSLRHLVCRLLLEKKKN